MIRTYGVAFFHHGLMSSPLSFIIASTVIIVTWCTGGVDGKLEIGSPGELAIRGQGPQTVLQWRAWYNNNTVITIVKQEEKKGDL